MCVFPSFLSRRPKLDTEGDRDQARQRSVGTTD